MPGSRLRRLPHEQVEADPRGRLPTQQEAPAGQRLGGEPGGGGHGAGEDVPVGRETAGACQVALRRGLVDGVGGRDGMVEARQAPGEAPAPGLGADRFARLAPGPGEEAAALGGSCSR